jgi:methionyl-tRNA formyltransferase
MRIEFLTQDDPLYVQPFFEEFFRHCAGEFEITRVSCCRAMGKRHRSQLLRELVCLYGSLGFLRLLGRVAAARLLGCLPRRRDASRFYTLSQLCRTFRVPCANIRNPNAAQFIDGVRSRRTDLLISVACPYILRAPLLALPPLGCINIHHAPLPQYKGMMPTFWQMYQGEENVGLTIHYMAARVDEGAALLQEELAIRPGETLDELIKRGKRHGAHCMIKVLRRIAQSNQTTISLLDSPGSYFTFPTPTEMKEFHRRGFRAI